ncbi:MAG: hypothetical protein P1V35_07255 [Planctomycetota bacterium]|nr:hypothetical protein [Planctomycetota bacterium]
MIRSFVHILGVSYFLLLAGADSAQAQTLLQRLHADPTAMQFGMSVDFAGDVDGDGFDDLVVGAPASAPSTGGIGAVEVFSGATGARL